jgi:hypothetical protein
MNAQIQGAYNDKGKALQVIISFCVRMIGIVAPVSGGSVSQRCYYTGATDAKAAREALIYSIENKSVLL